MNMIKHTSKKEAVYYYALNAPDGASEMDLIKAVDAPNFRNYVGWIQDELQFKFSKTRLQNKNTGCCYTLYAIKCRADAEKLFNLIQAMRKRKNAELLAEEERAKVLSLYPY